MGAVACQTAQSEPASEALQSRLFGSIVDPPLPRPTQALTDTQRRPYSLRDRPADELTVLMFGFTHCPDFCPTTAADLAAARSKLPAPLRERVELVFVTEDPKRDTPALLRRWLKRFDPTFVGLIGGNTSSAAMLKQLYSAETARVATPETQIAHPSTTEDHDHHGQYGVEHTSVVYAFGPGSRSVIYSGGATADDYLEDFRVLLGEAVS